MPFPLDHPPSVTWDQAADRMRFSQSTAGTRAFWNDLPRWRHWLRWQLLPSLPAPVRARLLTSRPAGPEAKPGASYSADQEHL
jgi:hypothetical protein